MTRKQWREIVKKLWEKQKSRRKNRNLLKYIDRKVSSSRDPLPPLSAAQKEEIRQFWGPYGFDDSALEYHRFLYGKTGQCRPDFLPEPYFYLRIKPALNDVKFGAVWSDKAYLDDFLRGIPTVRCVLRNVNGRWLDEQFRLIERREAEQILNGYEALVVKPSIDTNIGKGVVLLHHPFSLDSILASHKKNFVVQIPLHQHAELKKLNPSSVNTIRINSVLLDKEAHVMSAAVKVGQTGAFADNSGHERFFIGVRPDGTLMDYAVNIDLDKFSTIPSGFAFAGQSVPSFDKACRMIEKAHQCLPHFGLAFWDVCIQEDGQPAVVEVNLKNPNIMLAQVAAGPFFGEYTEEILRYISR